MKTTKASAKASVNHDVTSKVNPGDDLRNPGDDLRNQDLEPAPVPAPVIEPAPAPKKAAISKEAFVRLSILAQLILARQKVLLVGKPGIGKTGRVHDMVVELSAATGVEWKLKVWRLIQKDRLDTSGAIFPDKERGVSLCLPLEDLEYLRTTQDYVVFFMDDLGQAHEDVSSAVMAFFDRGAFGPNVRIMGATNCPKHGAGVKPFHEALRTRFDQAFEIADPVDHPRQKMDATGTLLQPWLDKDVSGNISKNCEVGGWLAWGVRNNIPDIFLAFHRAHEGKYMYNWQPAKGDFCARFADFRTWESMINLWRVGIKSFQVYCATIGRPVAAEFKAFAELVEKVPSLDQIRSDPEGALVPDGSSALFFVVTMLANAVRPIESEKIMKYVTRLGTIYVALFAKDLWMRHKDDQNWRTWFNSPSWNEWLKDNQDLLWQ
jgi:hypothetical protein